MSPINCPLGFSWYDACRMCRNKWEDSCQVVTRSPIPLDEILTTDERLRLIEDVKPLFPPAPPEHRLINKLRQVEGIANYTKTQLQQHLDKKKETYTINEK